MSEPYIHAGIRDHQAWFPFMTMHYMLQTLGNRLFFMEFKYGPKNPDIPGQLTFGWD